MSAAAERDTVWIGFMDIVPVIGTVKEAVELVLAVYEGNKAVIKEKEDAIKNIVKESFKKDVKKSTLSDKPAAAADEYSGLRNVREIRREKIIEYMNTASKSGATPSTSAEKKEREKRMEKIKEDMLKKIHIIDPDFKVELKKELERAKRGEHVFNNNILKSHSKVLKEFIQINNINNRQGYNQQAMDTLGKHTLSQNTADDIQTNMVVDFDKDDFYVNANGVVYGVYCRALREAMLVVLKHINPDKVRPEEKVWVQFVIDNMNNLQIYVDELARKRWIGNNATKQAQFEEVRGEVAHMYNKKRGVDWCIEILTEVAPLFGH